MIIHAVAASSFMQLQHDYGGPMNMGSHSGVHVAASWSFMQLQHDQILLIYIRITSHLAIHVRHFSDSNNATAAMIYIYV